MFPDPYPSPQIYYGQDSIIYYDDDGNQVSLALSEEELEDLDLEEQ